MTRHHGRLLTRVAVAALVWAALGACGDDTTRDQEAQPAPEPTHFVDGKFSDLVLYPGSRPAGERTDDGDVVARSFVVRDVAPVAVMEFYESKLAEGWHQVEPVRKIGSDETESYRGRWSREGRELLVSASRAPGLRSDAPSASVTTQYSLTLSQ